jgi:hypothetical protein
MKKSILTFVIVTFSSVVVYGQENMVSFSVGYPINFTHHWLVDEWEKPLALDLKFVHRKKLFAIGGGINYSKYDVAWFSYFDSKKNTVSNLNPYLTVGLNIDRQVVSLMPHIDLGYSTLFTDIEIYSGQSGGAFSGVGLDCNFKVTKRMLLGFGANYNMIFNKLDFDYEGAIPASVMTTEDNTMRFLSLNMNVAFRL